MLRVSAGQFTLSMGIDSPEWLLPTPIRASLNENWESGGLDPNHRYDFTLMVQAGTEPVLFLRHAGSRFNGWPLVLLVLKTGVLFVSSQEEIGTFDLNQRTPVERRKLPCPLIWRLDQHGTAVVVQSEMELAVWDLNGKRIWETFADPPHKYSVDGNVLKLVDFRGTYTFDLLTGNRLSTDPTTTINSPE